MSKQYEYLLKKRREYHLKKKTRSAPTKKQEFIITKKYESHPSKSLVKYILAISGMNTCDFENFFGMTGHTITNFTSSYNRNIPKKFWHIFLDPPKSITDKTKEIAEEIGIKLEKIFDTPDNHVEEIVKEEHCVKKIGVLADLLKNN